MSNPPEALRAGPSAARAAHPSAVGRAEPTADIDVALGLTGIRTTAVPVDGDGRHLHSLSIPGHRFGAARGRSWRTRRRQAWLGAGDHGTATLLGAHRSAPGDPLTPPAA